MKMHEFVYLSFKSTYPFTSFSSFLINRLAAPLIEFIFWATIALSILGSEYLHFVLLGLIIFRTTQTCLTGLVSMLRAERFNGTLELIVATPINSLTILFYKIIVPFLDSLLTMLICFTISNILFDFTFNYNQFNYIFIAICILYFSIIGISLIIGSISLIFSNTNLFLNLSLQAIAVLGGVYFSPTLLPDFLEVTSKYIPTSNILLAIRILNEGGSFESIYPLMWNEVVIGFTLILLGIYLVILLENISRKMGKLSLEE
ncbi:ABC transporter permease [Metasolibacillus meyeri]|uniref:ABC transporter permease n=1 Tax=Metasolibacillus meyeri TaxID=1071052 RepID=A0AAW9NUU1_9BACL|nr:ABC transporter permease [Metasolibacillus meyeri]MEC1178638.1 ABC transporter permease [Metasolibacillus meyeri]